MRFKILRYPNKVQTEIEMQAIKQAEEREIALIAFMQANMDCRLSDIYLAIVQDTGVWMWRRADREYGKVAQQITQFNLKELF